jgi:endonuclease/exonuclease/phosphatase (EEP) superfamily protein YafD
MASTPSAAAPPSHTAASVVLAPQPARSAAAPAALSSASTQGQGAVTQPAGQQVSEPDTDEAITVSGWNVGLDDADVDTIAARIAAFDGVDLWGITEVNRTDAVADLEMASEQGEVGDFAAVLGPSGGGMRLVALYDDTRFDLLEWYELEEINTTGNARAPLVLYLQDTLSDQKFLFMVNHLYRSREEERHKQAQLLNEWAAGKALPAIAVGDYNFDWDVQMGERIHDLGYDLMTEGGAWEWVRPAQLVTTQCSGWPCRYESVLDFVFAAGPAREWRAESEIVVAPGDFPDDDTTSDHRPVVARFVPQRTDDAAAVDSSTAPEPASAGDVPLATLAPIVLTTTPTVNRGANLRGGPGTNYPVVGGAVAGQAVDVIGRNSTGDWLKLADGTWIAAFLVDDAPANLATVGTAAASTAVKPANLAPAPTKEAPPIPVPPPIVEQPQTNCDPSYPTLCIQIGIGDLDCGDITARRFPVVGSDSHRFDGDHDGVGCESR